MNTSRQRTTITTAVLLTAAIASISKAAQWDDPGTSAFMATANVQIATAPPHCGRAPNCNAADVNNLFLPGFQGYAYGQQVRALCAEMVATCPLIADGFARTRVDGIGSSIAEVDWVVLSRTEHLCECAPYSGQANATINATIELKVGGVPANQEVTIHYSWWSLINNYYRPEQPAVPDDPTSTAGIILELNGDDLITPSPLNLVNVRALLALPPAGVATGSFKAHGGDVITIRIVGQTAAEINLPPLIPFNNPDNAEASYWGGLALGIDTPVPPFSNPTPQDALGFSLDIGSDAEMSDPNLDLDEVIDPGDLYAWSTPLLPAGGADGLRDDPEIFFADYWPQAPDGPPATTGAETCAGYSGATIEAMLADRFDLDATDVLDVDLRTYIDPTVPVAAPIPAFGGQCIHAPRYLLISFDDDDGGHYAGAGCDVPTGSLSSAGLRYGTTAGRDELVGLFPLTSGGVVAPGAPAVIGGQYAAADEVGVNVNLTPSPDQAENEDDDVDALDYAGQGCTQWYFSADHEARGIHPVTGVDLDPGAIYIVQGPPAYGPVKVIDPQVHLGLLPGVDIDAFEFVWLTPCDVCTPALALLFSVDGDDWWTAGADESGGLSPRMIYASYLDGTSFAFGDRLLQDDIDAIAATAAPWASAVCHVSSFVYWADDFELYPLGSLGGAGGWEARDFDPIRDGVVDNAQANSPTQSLWLQADQSVTQPITGVTSGKWTVETHAFLPTFVTGGLHALNLFNQYPPGGVGLPPNAISVQVVMDPAAGLVYDNGGTAAPLATGRWVSIRVEIDLDLDDVQIYYDGLPLSNHAWTAGGGPLELAGVNAEVAAGGFIYFDDFQLSGTDDCNGNGQSDLCDLVYSVSADCNSNGIPDECDIASGASSDNNGNGVPDECEVVLGDMNCDGVLSFADINPFVLALLDPVAYAAAYPGCDPLNGDFSGNGSLGFEDINGFVAALVP